MKVLFITRPTVFSGPGGDTVQLLKTKEFLELLGVSVDIADTSFPELTKYDLIHFFNLRNPQDILHHVKRAKKIGIPTVLSTIWGSYLECDQKCRQGLTKWLSNNVSEYKLEYLKVLARTVLNLNFHTGMVSYFLSGHHSAQKYIVNNVNYLLPNSPTELERVRFDTNVNDKSGSWVANAVDTTVFDYDNVQVNKSFEKYEGCLLCAARVEIRKSQLDLVMACKGLPYKLVVVGKPSPNSISYYNECKMNAGDNVEFIDHVTHEELAQLYKVAHAHALISWMETPGLSSLEAGVMGCNLLLTDRGDTPFYFENYAEYVEPGNINSIRDGVVKVMSRKFDPKLKEHILNKFTWQHTAEQTLDGYKRAIKLNG